MSAASAGSPLPPHRPARTAGAARSGGPGAHSSTGAPHEPAPPPLPAPSVRVRAAPAGGLERRGGLDWGGPGAGGARHRPRDERRPRLYGSGTGRRRVLAVRPLLCSRRRRLGPAPAVPPGRSRDRFGSQADGPLLSSRGFSKPSEESGIFRSFLYIRPLQDLEMSTTLLSAFYDIDFLCKVGESAFGRAGRGLPLPPCAERLSGLPGQRGGAGGPCRAGRCGRVTL